MLQSDADTELHSTPLRSNVLDLKHRALQRHDFMVIAQILCLEMKPPGKYLDLRNITLDITITILDIIYRPVFYLKYDVSETGFCLFGPETEYLYLLGPTE
jgi:hypothetical protein